ncbi:MAG: hypothetical protein WD670_00255, partial [Actinomycetota bacterium]
AADTLGVPLLGQIPLMPALREGGDEGTPIVLSEPDAPASVAMREAGEELMKLVNTKIGKPLDLMVKPKAGAVAAGGGGHAHEGHAHGH